MAGLRALPLLSVLLLGCVAEPGEDAAAIMRDALRSARAGVAAVGPPPAADRGTPDPAQSAARATAAVAPGLPPPPAGPRQPGVAPPAAAAALLGRPAAELRRMLGEPALRRPEGEAEIWLYEAPDCRLDLVLYPEGGALRVAHAVARAHGARDGVTEAACLAAIAVAPAPAPWTAPATGRRA